MSINKGESTTNETDDLRYPRYKQSQTVPADSSQGGEQEWQPIATAPKDARWLRVKLPDGSECRAHYAEGNGEDQPTFRGWFIDVEVGSSKGGYFSEIDIPTHWKPDSSGEQELPDNLYDGAILLLRSWAACMGNRPSDWQARLV